MAIVIGVDIGTSNIKVVAANTAGELLFNAAAPCDLIRPEAAKTEQDPTMVLEVVNKLLQQAFAALTLQHIVAVSFSAAMHSIMAVDAAGSCLTNAWLWGDARATEQETALKQDGGGAALYKHTGVPLHPSLPICKIAWFKQQEPALFAKTHKFISLKEYLFFNWFGVYKVDCSIAASSGLLDVQELQWSREALAAIGITPDQLSEVVPIDHQELDLKPAFKLLWKLSSPVPFVMGSSDGCLANIGSGVVDASAAALTIGTSGAVRLTGARYISSNASLFCYPVTADIFVTGGAVNNGGYVLEWFAENMLQIDLSQNGAYARLIDEAASAAPGADGLVFLPYLLGDRAPIWNAKARGVFFGLHNLHQQKHMIRAVIEGVNYALYDIFSEMAAISHQVEALYVSGGFIRSPFWIQMIADIFNKKIAVREVADASVMGAISVGFYATGFLSSIKQPLTAKPVEKEYYPDMERHDLYQKNFQMFKSLYVALKNEFLRWSN